MTGVWPRNWRPILHDTLPSTQGAAIDAALGGAEDGLVIMARRQTAGRGSRGRSWQAPAGNLNFSLLLRPGNKGRSVGAWPLLAGVALHDALAPLLPAPEALMLKWPNDVLLQGRKLAGILIDTASAADGAVDWVVIGVGVNIQIAPDIAGQTTTSLAAVDAAISPELLGATLACALSQWMSAEMEEIRAAWLQRAHPIGTSVALRHVDRLVHGDFAGLSPDGGLLLTGHANPITVGEIQFAARQAAPCC